MSTEVFLILDDGEETYRFGEEVEVHQVDIKGYMDYETAVDLINEALDSNLDGPDQMQFIQAVTDAFLKDAS